MSFIRNARLSTRIVIFGLGLIGVGFTTWAAETAINELVDNLVTSFSGKSYTKEVINTWNVTQWMFVVGAVCVIGGVLSRSFLGI